MTTAEKDTFTLLLADIKNATDGEARQQAVATYRDFAKAVEITSDLDPPTENLEAPRDAADNKH